MKIRPVPPGPFSGSPSREIRPVPPGPFCWGVMRVIGNFIIAVALPGASHHTTPRDTAPIAIRTTAARTAFFRSTPPRTARTASINAAPSAVAANVPACVSAAMISRNAATNHQRVAPRPLSDRIAIHPHIHVPAMNTYAIDCFSKSPTIRSNGALTVIANPTAIAPGIIPRLPPAKIHAAMNNGIAAIGSASASTKREAKRVAVSISHPMVTIKHLASAASTMKVIGTSAHRSVPRSSKSRACTA